MRLPRLLFVATLAALSGCSYTTAGGITGRIESSSETTIESPASSWSSSPLTVRSSQGSIAIVGVPGKTNISVHARFVAGANNQSDADAAFADLAATLEIKNGAGGWVVDCTHAAAWHGSVDPESTGCSSLRIEVPAGTAVPHQIVASSEFGGVHVSGVTVTKLDVTAPFGIVADVLPRDDAEIHLTGSDLVSGLCSTVLRIPETTSIGAVSLTVDNPSLHYVGVSDDDPTYWLGAYIEGFANAPRIAPRSAAATWQQGSAPFDAKSITLRASLGKALLTTASIPPYREFNECLDQKLEVRADAR